MKANPWMIVSLVLACACGYLVGSTENEAEASTPKYQYFYDPDGVSPIQRFNNLQLRPGQKDRPMCVRVDLSTMTYEWLAFGFKTNPDGLPVFTKFWKELQDYRRLSLRSK